MNSSPVFRDRYGNPFLKLQRRPRQLRPWQRMLFAVLIVGIGPFIVMGAATQINLASQVQGLLGGANGGLNVNASAFTGVLREASGTASAAEISGDCATSGSMVLTCTKVNSTTVPTNAAANTVLLTTASATGSWAALSDTSAGGLAETYNATTHVFGTISVPASTFYQETPSGTPNGVLTTFTLAHTPVGVTSVLLFANGVAQTQGASADYTLSGATITYNTAPPTGTILLAQYH